MAEFTFGPFRFDVAAARLSRDNVEVRLRPQALQVLRVLLHRRGQAIGYDQMIAEGWQGTFVSRHTVDVTVGEVKKVLGEYGRWIVHRPKVGYSLEVPTSDELVRKGWHFASRRTKEGAERAIECFQRAASECPGDFRAFEGLSTCYLMQATFGICAPVEVYPRFLEAHNRAVEQGVLTPELRCNRAHGLHMFEHRPLEAEREFLRAREEKPTFATVHVRMALTYATLGQLDRSLEVLAQGYQADPLLPTLPSAETLVHVWRRDFDKAIVVGSKAIELHPYLQISRANYAQALEFSGRLTDALAQYQLGSIMSGDLPWMRALEGTCLAKLGRTSEAQAILDELQHRRKTDYADALYMAVLWDALGEREEAFKEIERAFEENSAFLYSIGVDPKMDTFRKERRFARLKSSLETREIEV
jgi:DNA-binding winged helix-turn-helix (wHTH) protein/Flp pilus assembly protein TadD